jgi:GNAT superfamily N-acetyltransferase
VIEVRRVRPDEWAELRAIRLQALADSPGLFARPLAYERELPEQRWRSTASNPVFVAIAESEWVAMAGLYRHEHATPLVIWGMWVRRDLRGTGIGRALLKAMLEFADQQGESSLRLGVVESNLDARRLYEGVGFTYTGKSYPFLPDPSQLEMEMELKLSPA